MWTASASLYCSHDPPAETEVLHTGQGRGLKGFHGMRALPL